GAAVELGELLVRDLAEPAHRAGQLDTAPAARTDHAQLDLEALRGGREALEVLAGLERPDCEHEVALGSAAVRREDGGDGVRDDADALLVDAQQLDELPLRELGDRNHTPRGADDPRHERATVRARPEPERLGI